MQHRTSRCAYHTSIAVGYAGTHALKQAQHHPHTRHMVYQRHKCHLRIAGVGKTHIDPAIDEGLD